MTRYANDLSVGAFQNLIRCNPAHPSLLLGLTNRSLENLLLKMDLPEMILMHHDTVQDIWSKMAPGSSKDAIGGYLDMILPYQPHISPTISYTALVGTGSIPIRYLQVGPTKYISIIDYLVQLDNITFTIGAAGLVTTNNAITKLMDLVNGRAYPGELYNIIEVGQYEFVFTRDTHYIDSTSLRSQYPIRTSLTGTAYIKVIPKPEWTEEDRRYHIRSGIKLELVRFDVSG